MIVEMREYTLHYQKVPEFLSIYEQHGLPIQLPILGHLVGYFVTEVGVQNEVVHLWAYEDFADRDARRAKLAAQPGWKDFLGKIQPLILTQKTRIMRPAPFFELSRDA